MDGEDTRNFQFWGEMMAVSTIITQIYWKTWVKSPVLVRKHPKRHVIVQWRYKKSPVLGEKAVKSSKIPKMKH